MTRALIVVDFQNDFTTGSLATNPPESVKNTIIRAADESDYVVYTRDWHPENHFSFSDDPGYQDGDWPSHCVQDTEGAEIDSTLLSAVPADAVFDKGVDVNVEAYSGFDGTTDDGTTLDEWLIDHDVSEVLITGIATDYCVRATAIDAAAQYGYETVVLVDGVQGVAPHTSLVAAADMGESGARLATLEEIKATGF